MPYLLYNNQTSLIKELNFDGWCVGLQPALGKRRNDRSCRLEPCHLNFAACKEVMLKKRRVIFILNYQVSRQSGVASQTVQRALLMQQRWFFPTYTAQTILRSSERYWFGPEEEAVVNILNTKQLSSGAFEFCRRPPALMGTQMRNRDYAGLS